VVREQDPVSIGLGVAGLVVGLTGLGLQVADTVEGNSKEQSKYEAILQEIRKLVSREEETPTVCYKFLVRIFAHSQ